MRPPLKTGQNQSFTDDIRAQQYCSSSIDEHGQRVALNDDYEIFDDTDRCYENYDERVGGNGAHQYAYIDVMQRGCLQL